SASAGMCRAYVLVSRAAWITRARPDGIERASSRKTLSEPLATVVDDGHHDQDQPDDRQQSGKVQQIHRVLELLADAAGADDPEHGRRAHVELPPEEADRDHRGRDVG